jgi:hypothetical protein
MLLLLSGVLFALLLVLPAVPAWLHPPDAGDGTAEAYMRDPRWFGAAFRSRLRQFVDQARTHGYGRAALQMRTEEDVRWSPNLLIPAGQRQRGIGVGERVTVGTGAGIRDAYALEDLDVEHDVVARTLTSDRTLHIGADVHVLRWVDAEGPIDVAAGADLGVSASGGSRVTLGDQVQFERIWGAPIRSHTGVRTPFTLSDAPGVLIIANAPPGDGPIIVHGAAHVAAGTALPSDLKVNGELGIASGARIGGNVIVRGNVTIAEDVAIDGHVLCDGDVRLGPRTRVARPGRFKSVYASGAVIIADDVEVYGLIAAETGGYTL